jgi:hypothetical protein
LARSTLLALLTVGLGLATMPVRAQDPVMSSGKTTYPGDLKFGVYPTVDFDADEVGAAGRFGYGFGRVDAEGRLGLSEGRFLAGVQLDLSLVETPGVAMALSLGAHRTQLDRSRDVTGIDGTLVISTPISPKTDLYGSLDLDFEYPDDGGRRFTATHVVGGVELHLARGVDFLVELGLGANSRSNHYAAAGLTVYVQ